MEALSQAYRALGDATRLRVLRLIAQTPLNVSEIVSLVGIAQPSVSHHLGKLKAMKVLVEERQNGYTYYALDLDKDDARWPLVKVAIEDTTDGDGDLSRLAELLRRREAPQGPNPRPLPGTQAPQDGRPPAGARAVAARRGVGTRPARPPLAGIRPGAARGRAGGGGVRQHPHRDVAGRGGGVQALPSLRRGAGMTRA